VGNVAKGVLKSNVFQVATKALSFVPGFNAVGVIGKGLSMLGSGASIQKWLKSGLNIFQNLKKGFDLTDSVKKLFSGKFQPLGMLSNLVGGSANPLQKGFDFLKALQPKLGLFQQLQGFMKQLPMGNLPIPKEFLPPGLSDLKQVFDRSIRNLVSQLENPSSRNQMITGMFQELLRNLEKPLPGLTGPMIRA
jgi:hypothetical protein